MSDARVCEERRLMGSLAKILRSSTISTEE